MGQTRDPDLETGSSLRLELPSEAVHNPPNAKQWFDCVLESTHIATAVISLYESRYLCANAAMAEMFGLPLPDLLNSDPFNIAYRVTHPDDLAAEGLLFGELASGQRRFYEIVKRYCRPDGSVRWGRATFGGVHDYVDSATVAAAGPSVALKYVVLQIVDVTEQREQAEALERYEVEVRHAQKVDGLGRLAAGIAHDFNNLLTVITGHGEVIRGVVDDPKSGWAGPDVRADLDAILEAAERGASLTAQLLAHGRREKVSLRTFVLSDLVATLKRLLLRTLGSNIHIVESLTAKGAIRADQGQVGQVVMNLMLNARDAITDGGHIWLTTSDVSISEAGEGGGPELGEWVSLRVADDGHGMSLAVQEHMFEPFFTTRTDRAGTRGSGLGLATVRRIVEEANAHIDVKSAPDSGTSVTIYFPRVAHTAGAEALMPRPKGNVVGKHTVLVVEDDPAVRSLIATVLLGAHYRVMVARDGVEGLRVLDSEPGAVHLIVTDLMMPGLGGLALARTLSERELSPRLLFISGYSNHTPLEIAPFGKLLPKPFTPAQLVTAVREALGETAEQREHLDNSDK